MRLSIVFATLSAALIAPFAHAASWQATITHDPAGSFPPLRSCRGTYAFSWGGVVAASGEARFTRDASGSYVGEAHGGTQGLARMMWRYDVTHRASVSSALRPIEMQQTDTERNKIVRVTNTFAGDSVSSLRTDSKNDKKPPKTKHFAFPELYDLSSAFLYLRSQPLTQNATYRVVVFPETSPYLATLTVTGRDKLRVHAGTFNAIKIDVQLNKITKAMALEPHKKFKRATAWISDDQDRIPLRIEAAVFVGTVSAELQTISFDEAPKP
jgi:hypothetical protein